MSAFSALGPWLRRWRRVRLAAADVVVGAQWVGAELLLARVRADAERPQVDAVAAFPAPAEARGAVVARLAAGKLLRGARLIVLLAPGQYDVHAVTAPAVPDDELRDALRWQLRANLPYPPEEAVLDFVRLPQAAHGNRQSLLAVAAHRPVIESAVAAFVEHGVPVDAVDVPEFAQRNLARAAATAGTNAWLGFERETCLLTAHYDGELAFARRMLLPGAQAEGETPESAQHLAERVTVQTQRTLDLFERQSGLPPVTEVVVGPHRHAARIAEVLADRTGLAVSVFDPRTAFDFGPQAAIDRETTARALAAVGAALRDEVLAPA